MATKEKGKKLLHISPPLTFPCKNKHSRRRKLSKETGTTEQRMSGIILSKMATYRKE